jgi:hypothetical protein
MKPQQKDFDLLTADIDRAIKRAERLNLNLMVYMLRMAKMELLDKVSERDILEAVDNRRPAILQ